MAYRVRSCALGTLLTALIATTVIGVQDKAAAIRNPVARTPDSVAAGGQLFRRACASCHGLDAKGRKLETENPDPGPDPPDLTDATWQYGSTEGEIFSNVKYGIGPTMYMDKYGDVYKDEQIWDIVNYLMSLAPQATGRPQARREERAEDKRS